MFLFCRHHKALVLEGQTSYFCLAICILCHREQAMVGRTPAGELTPFVSFCVKYLIKYTRNSCWIYRVQHESIDLFSLDEK